MSTHNIGFYEDLTKNIFESSSNIIKYAPYFFCCYMRLISAVLGGNAAFKDNSHHVTRASNLTNLHHVRSVTFVFWVHANMLSHEDCHIMS